MKRLAILDLGTNTFHLLIAEVQAGKAPVQITKESLSIKLGEGGITENIITDAAFIRGINALNRFHEIILQYSVDEIRAAGTAALRGAKNGPAFIERVKQDTGIEIEIIDGDKEAGLIYEGVRHAVKLNSTTVLITDIGGGSVEFILCNRDKIFWKKSYPIGAAKLMALFHHTDPVSVHDITSIEEFLDKELADLKAASKRYKPEILIGSAGAFDTFAELEVLQFNLDPILLQQTEFNIDTERFKTITDHLLATTHQQREVLPGLAEIRVDMIIVATILTKYILKELDIRKMNLSAYSMKEGLLFQNLS